jgi:hypothetical protein
LENKVIFILINFKKGIFYIFFRINDKEGLVPAVYLRPHTILNQKLKETLNLVDSTTNNSASITSMNSQNQYETGFFENNKINRIPYQPNTNEISKNEHDLEKKEEENDKKEPDFYYSIDKYIDNAGDGVSLVKGQRVSVNKILNFIYHKSKFNKMH